jgi:hypothetical protein
MNTTVVGYRVFAMMRAKRMAQDDVKRKGHRWSSYTAAEKQAMTMLYLELHPEIVKQAKADIDRLTLDGAFGRRAQKAALAAQAQS